MNSSNPSLDSEPHQARTAAGVLGLKMDLYSARTDAEIDATFRAIALLRVGVYAGRVLKGAAPASLPVQRPMRYELVVNLTI